jgi:hypothetical protein
MSYIRLPKIIKKLQTKRQSEPREITEESSDVGVQNGPTSGSTPWQFDDDDDDVMMMISLPIMLPLGLAARCADTTRDNPLPLRKAQGTEFCKECIFVPTSWKLDTSLLHKNLVLEIFKMSF